MQRRVALLTGLVLAALASLAAADDDVALPAQANWFDSAPPAMGGGSYGPGSRMILADPEALPSHYIARHPNPGEPLGFSGSRFAPHAGPLVDPAATSAVFDTPVMEFQESPNPHAPAPAVSSADWLRDSHWYTEQSAVYYSRTANIRNTTRLAFDFQDLNSLDVQLDLGYEPGLRSTLGRYLGRDARDRDHSVEFTFLGLMHWGFAESMTARIPGSIFQTIAPLLNVPVYSFSDVQAFSQTSDFNSYEVNYRIDRRLGRDRMVYTRDSSWVREATPSLLCSVYAGIRVAIVNETIDWTASDNLGNGSYVVVTHNNMVGPQAGADLFYEHSNWRAGVRGSAGSLVNWASQSSTVRILQPDGTPLSPNRDEFAKDHTLGFVGGLNFIGEYRFRPTFGLRLSYDLLWATNLALAQNQLTFFPSTPTEISTSHTLFMQGVTLGLEWFR